MAVGCGVADMVGCEWGMWFCVGGADVTILSSRENTFTIVTYHVKAVASYTSTYGISVMKCRVVIY